jgi:undecaprenyl-diphosphatase
VAPISDPRRRPGGGVVSGSVRPALAGVALAAVAALALLEPSARRERLDRGVGRALQLLPERPAVRLSAAVAASPHQALATGAVLGAALLLVRRDRQGEAMRLGLASALAATTSVALKRLLRRPRPAAERRMGRPRSVLSPGGRPIEHSGRFPSGHTTSAAIAALAASRALTGAGGLRVVGTTAAAAGALVVGGSRVHLAEHYASDVLASYCLVLAAALALPRRAVRR